MKTKKMVVFLLYFFTLLILAILACAQPSSLPSVYEINSLRMATCKKPDQVCSLIGSTSISPSSAENICIVWTEVNRPTTEKLNVYIYNENRSTEFSYVDSVESVPKNEARECKFIVIDQPLPAGTYTTEFSSSGQVNVKFEWELIKNYSPIK